MPYNFGGDSFHTDVTTEALWAKIERKSTISLQRSNFTYKAKSSISDLFSFVARLYVYVTYGRVLSISEVNFIVGCSACTMSS